MNNKLKKLKNKLINTYNSYNQSKQLLDSANKENKKLLDEKYKKDTDKNEKNCLSLKTSEKRKHESYKKTNNQEYLSAKRVVDSLVEERHSINDKKEEINNQYYNIKKQLNSKGWIFPILEINNPEAGSRSDINQERFMLEVQNVEITRTKIEQLLFRYNNMVKASAPVSRGWIAFKNILLIVLCFFSAILMLGTLLNDLAPIFFLGLLLAVVSVVFIIKNKILSDSGNRAIIKYINCWALFNLLSSNLINLLDEEIESRNGELNTNNKNKMEHEEIRHREAIKEITERYLKQKNELNDKFQINKEKLSAKYKAENKKVKESFDKEKNQILTQIDEIRDSVSDILHKETKQVTLDDMTKIYMGDMHADIGNDGLSIPYYYDFYEYRPLVIYDEGSSRSALSIVKSLLLRSLYKIPSGKLYCMFFDPIHLGKSFSEFMTLADYDQTLVHNKIWTEPELLKRLLQEHKYQMENTIQFILRNVYNSIEDYNKEYGEIKEPYRFLILADFPSGFDVDQKDGLYKLLQSIIINGPKCGIHTILIIKDDSIEKQKDLINNILKECNFIRVKNKNKCIINDENNSILNPSLIDVKKYYEKVFNNIKESLDHHKVIVDFDKIIKKTGFDWYRGDASKKVSIPLGPAGAHRVQMLEIGEASKQHVLVSGKTGSGKSTLFHIIITTLMMKYSPDEVELYLIDFKKGVEFKKYGEYKIPHARVIAIAGESEFGFSVLENLNNQLEVRGKLFRKNGIENISEFRTKIGKPLARIILIVDEFQEFFATNSSKDEKARQYFNRLVRQGRAFGIHLILGTQSLAGTIPSDIKNQMSIRIALSSSEDDSRNILANDNLAAMMLKNPGEAIYNAENGVIEGNQSFQVSWLEENRRDKILTKICKDYDNYIKSKGYRQYIFEGNAYSNVLLSFSKKEIIEISNSNSVSTYLGDPISISAPVQMLFQRSRGNNVLILGRDSSSTEGMLLSMILMILIQKKIDKKLLIVDYSSRDSSFRKRLSELSKQDPNHLENCERNKILEIFRELAAEVDQRINKINDKDDFPFIFLIINHIQKARDLDADADSQLSFSEKTEEQLLMELLYHIMKEGPDLHVYTIINCDINANLKRRITRKMMKEMDHRVCFQMGREDSLEIMNNYDATNLGVFKAIYLNETNMEMKQFKPFAIPEKADIDEVYTFVR